MPREGYEPMLDEARSKYELLGAGDRMRVDMYSGGHHTCLREESTYDEIGRWFAKWLA